MNITLIGMPGSGKTTVGQALAEKLGWGFVDTDSIIAAQRATLQTILDTEGAAAFRKIEMEAIVALSALERTIISPGGSVVYSERSMEHLKSISTIIYLDVPLAVIRGRIDETARGIIGLKEKGWDVLFAERTTLYKKYADFTLVPRGGPPEEDALQILEEIPEIKKLVVLVV